MKKVWKVFHSNDCSIHNISNLILPCQTSKLDQLWNANKWTETYDNNWINNLKNESWLLYLIENNKKGQIQKCLKIPEHNQNISMSSLSNYSLLCDFGLIIWGRLLCGWQTFLVCANNQNHNWILYWTKYIILLYQIGFLVSF